MSETVCAGVKGVPASGGTSCGSAPELSSSETVPAACCVFASSSPSPPPLSASPPHGPSPTRPAAEACSAFWAAPSSSAGSCPPHRPPPPRDWRMRSCRRLPRTSAFCVSLSGCRRSKSPQNRSGPGPPAHCPLPGSSESRTGIRTRRKRRSLRHCRPGWRRVGRSVASSMRPPWFSASTRTFSACTSSPCLRDVPETTDMKQKTEKEEPDRV